MADITHTKSWPCQWTVYILVQIKCFLKINPKSSFSQIVCIWRHWYLPTRTIFVAWRIPTNIDRSKKTLDPKTTIFCRTYNTLGCTPNDQTGIQSAKNVETRGAEEGCTPVLIYSDSIKKTNSNKQAPPLHHRPINSRKLVIIILLCLAF